VTVVRAVNSMFWFVDKEVEAARKHPGWKQFHRECGKAGLYFDDIERSAGRRSPYTAYAYSLSKSRRGFYQQNLVARGRAPTPNAVVLDCFDKAVAAGFDVDPSLRNLLVGDAVAPPADDDEFADILGDDARSQHDEFEDILG